MSKDDDEIRVDVDELPDGTFAVHVRGRLRVSREHAQDIRTAAGVAWARLAALAAVEAPQHMPLPTVETIGAN